MRSVPHFSNLSVYPVLFLLVATTLPATAQQGDTTVAHRYYEAGAARMDAYEYRNAIFYFEKAYTFYKQNTSSVGQAKCYNKIGDAYYMLAQYDTALNYYKKFLSLLEEHLDTSVANPNFGIAYYNIAWCHRSKSQYNKALYYYKKNLDVMRRVFGDKHPKLVRCHTDIGDVLSQKNDDQALTYLHKALDIQKENLGAEHPKTANVYMSISTYYHKKGDYDQSLLYTRKALQVQLKSPEKDTKIIAGSYINLGIAWKKKGHYEQALTYYQKALTMTIKRFGEEHPNTAIIYNNMGNTYRAQGDPELSLTYYRKSLAIYQKIYGDKHHLIAQSYNNIASAYYDKNDTKMALFYARKALAVFIEIYGKQHPKVAEVYNNMGYYYVDYDEAQELVCFKKATQIWKRTLGDTNTYIAGAYGNIGKHYERAGDTSLELYYHKKALDMFCKLSESNGPDVSQAYANIGVYYKKRTHYKKALHHFQQALLALLGDFKDSNIYSNPNLKNRSAKKQLLDILHEKAKSMRLYYKKSKDVQDLLTSYQTWQLSVDLIDSLRYELISKEAKRYLSDYFTSIYEEAIHTAYHLYTITKDQQYMQQAFILAEKSKAFLLLQALNETKAKQFSNIADSTLQREKTLKTDIAFYEKSLFDARQQADSGRIALYENYLFAKKVAYRKLIQQLETNTPRYYRLKYDTKVASFDKVKKQVLDKNTALIEYFVADSTIFIFSIYKNKMQMIPMAGPPDFDQSIIHFRKNLSDYRLFITNADKAWKTYTQQAHELYQLLLAPVLDHMSTNPEKLLIIPDGLLGYLPFEILLDCAPKINEKNYGKLPYLVKKYQMRYAYSSTLLLHNKQNRSAPNNGQCLAFTPDGESFDGASSLAFNNLRSIGGALPGSQKEVKAIAQHFKGRFYFGRHATEQHFKKEAGTYRIIHLAMHGLANQEQPLYSKLAFNETGDTVEDGLLYTYELYNMQLNAELVVLSACETGYGKSIKGEGIMSMARGFMYAGSPSVVYTLWKVDDRASSQLMSYFYEALSRGIAKDKALQQARIRYMKETEGIKTHPFYWSGFVLTGNGEALSEGRSLWYRWIASVIAVLVVWLVYRKSIEKKAA